MGLHPRLAVGADFISALATNRADMKSAPTTEMSNQHYEERAVPRHTPKSVGAAARRRVLANILPLFGANGIFWDAVNVPMLHRPCQ